MPLQRPSCLSIGGLNHVSRVCADVQETANFYRNLLGFLDIKRPRFDFEGAWLFHPHSSVGLHLIKGTPVYRSSAINPKADHLSFLCPDLLEVEDSLIKSCIEYVKQCVVEEDGIRVTQVFFHDPDNNMIEICNCDEFPLVLLGDETVAAEACPTCRPDHHEGNVFLVHSRSGVLLSELPETAGSTSSDDMSADDLSSLDLVSIECFRKSLDEKGSSTGSL
ncbi:hypothetical protein CEUSTIGMA_g4538.t1 [Chlamydomonas eustigma]|uniref:VOC domain-containing protein n=1 Tax=Chlamydomonas eustigma TaxID=1157962 RepID=A0A250X2H4_9CHLO|nr:hypothetical protein CEUSTIGMA_g4538.t1 [Chlamydomonas eustigma]|eukprot:GAX77092.1 hypothetical protein CEUSTIGMA_g4538.t1 [Chlamydomonas eustigma]